MTAAVNVTGHVAKPTFQVPHEVTAFLIAVACCIVLLFVFFLYLNKTLCFRSCPSLGTVFSDRKQTANAGKLIGNYDDAASHGVNCDTSSDSDDEVLRHYEQAVRLSRPNSQYNVVGASAAPLGGGVSQLQQVPDATTVGDSRHGHHHHHQHHHHQSQQPQVKDGGRARGSDSSRHRGVDESVASRSGSRKSSKGAKREHKSGGGQSAVAHNGGHEGPYCDDDEECEYDRGRHDDDGRRPILQSSCREMTSYGGLSETTQRDRTSSSICSASSSSMTTAFDNPAYVARIDGCGGSADFSPQRSINGSRGGGMGTGVSSSPVAAGSSADSPSPVSATGATRPSTAGSSSRQSMTGVDHQVTSARPNDDRHPEDKNPQNVDHRPFSSATAGDGAGPVHAPATPANGATTMPSAATGSAPMFIVGACVGDASDVGTDQEDHLFDIGDLQEQEQEPAIISKCGSLRVTFHFQVTSAQSTSGRMSVTVHEARDIPAKDRGGAQHTQVHILLLPSRKTRHRTKIRSTGDEDNPKFDETFVFKVPTDDVGSMGLRLRLYGCERMRRERLIGECVVGFAMLVGANDSPIEHWLTLEPRSNLSHGDSKADITSLTRSDSGSSCQSMGFQHGGMPELLLGLAYNDVTGRLSVQVIKGSNFKNMAMTRAPDTYVKLTLMAPGGQEITRSKTSVRRGQPNPLYKETFMFQVALFQLPDVTLMVSVFYNRSIKRKEMIGWFSLGYSNSSDEELSHWSEMRDSKGEEVCRWHALLEP